MRSIRWITLLAAMLTTNAIAGDMTGIWKVIYAGPPIRPSARLAGSEGELPGGQTTT